VRILLVEDEKKVAKAVQEGLEHEGYSIRVAHTGEYGFYLINSEPFDLIILDVMLPGRSGLEILSTARSRGLCTAVLILTARTPWRTA
jgi:DNA-binding response OmpR family regulator